MVQTGLLPYLVLACHSGNEKLLSEALWIMTNIAGSDDRKAIDALVENKVHEIMIEIVNSVNTDDNHETAIWFIGNIQIDVPEIRS